MSMNTTGYKLDFAHQTITLTASFASKANDPKSAEYELLLRLQHDFPNLKIVNRTHASPSSYKVKGQDKKRTSYYPTKGMTFNRMEQFMNALPEGEKYLEEYNKLKSVAVPDLCHSRYTIVRRWFEAQFPKFRENPLFYVKNSVEVIDYATFLDTVA